MFVVERSPRGFPAMDEQSHAKRIWREVVDGVEVEVIEFSDSVETVEKASRLSGYPRHLIVKTLLLKADNEYIVAVARGDRKVDNSKAEKVLGKRVELAKSWEVKQVLGVDPGAVTPISKKVKSLRVLVDPQILALDYVVCGGGSLNRLYKVKTKELLEYLNPQIIDIFK